ncbi:uncharacterized protein LOC111036671 [Myzus persicae]|uniref:uncharacterized protein LOC111036671 n=1 Tax=Myzus persicae TaxID=13164 RepID=UPI000B935053|nr:uncharacterized protein LOC111036671 [Myzus persicae]
MVHLKKILSEQLGIGIGTIYQTILEYKRSKTISSPNRTKKFKNVKDKVDDFDKYAIRRKIHKFWSDREFPTLDKILQVINEDKDLPDFSRTSLYRLLKSMDFEYVKQGRNSALIEKTEIVDWRRRYLRAIRRYREEGRPIYYLDETWVNAGDVPHKVWCDKSIKSARDATSKGLTTGAVKPSGKGKRLIVCHIGSEDGFVPDSLLCFESKKNTQDYHDEMNGECFREWLESVLPRLKDNAVIVMDNAPYHSVKQEKCPNLNTRKADIIAWLESKREVVDKSMVIRELIPIVNRLKPIHNKYVIDEMVKTHNKDVLRLPPYHCELNPIELAWSSVKNYVRKNNTTFKLQDVKRLLIEGVKRVDSEMWKNFIKHVVDEEDKLWNMDFIVDELTAEQEPCVLNLGPDDSDSESNSESESDLDSDNDIRHLSDE